MPSRAFARSLAEDALGWQVADSGVLIRAFGLWARKLQEAPCLKLLVEGLADNPRTRIDAHGFFKPEASLQDTSMNSTVTARRKISIPLGGVGSKGEKTSYRAASTEVLDHNLTCKTLPGGAVPVQFLLFLHRLRMWRNPNSWQGNGRLDRFRAEGKDSARVGSMITGF